MDWTALGTILALIVGIVNAVWTLKEHREKKKAQAELKEIHRRGDAPYLTRSTKRFSALHRNIGGGSTSFYPVGASKGMLCEFRDEVDLSDGGEVLFVIEYSGANARSLIAKLDGENIGFGCESDVSPAQGRYYLAYLYKKSKHGQEQQLSISFETVNGSQDTHTYLTRHGCRVLYRIEPPLPS